MWTLVLLTTWIKILFFLSVSKGVLIREIPKIRPPDPKKDWDAFPKESAANPEPPPVLDLVPKLDQTQVLVPELVPNLAPVPPPVPAEPNSVPEPALNPSFPPEANYDNVYEEIKVRLARELNQSDCWVCSQMMTGGEGFPWKVIPFGWSEYCAAHLTFGSISGTGNDEAFIANCTQEKQHSMIQFAPQDRTKPKSKPVSIKVSGNGIKGLYCERVERGSFWKNPWFAGNSICQYYRTPTENFTIPSYLENGTQSIGFLHYYTPLTVSYWKDGASPQGTLSGSYWVCGNRAYKWLPDQWWGSCYLAILAPPFRLSKTLPEGRPRHRRELVDVSDRPVISEGKRFWFTMCPMCAAASYGTYINKLSHLIEEVANETSVVLNSISHELVQMRMVVLQNRMALDYLLASSGGTCALIGSTCCTFIEDGFKIQQTGVKSIDRAIQQWEKQKDADNNWWNWLTNLLPNLSWLKYLLMVFICIVVLGIIICCVFQCLPCIISCCKFPTKQMYMGTVISKEQIDLLEKKVNAYRIELGQ